MADFFSRLGNLVKGAAENFIKGLESDNPEAVIESALQTQAARVSELSGHVSTLGRRIETRRKEISTLESEVAQLTSRAAALANSDEAQALAVIELKERTTERLTEAQRGLVEDEKRLDTTEETLARTKAEFEKLKREKDQLLVEFHSLSARNEHSNLEQGVPSSAAYQAVQNVRDSLNKAEDVLKKGRDDKEIRRLKAQAELEALKQRAAQGTGSSASASAGPQTGRTLDVPGQSTSPAAGEGADAAPKEDDSSPMPRRSL